MPASVAPGQESRQLPEPGLARAQETEARKGTIAGLGLDEHIGADDRLDPGLDRGAEELDHCRDVALVGQRQRGKTERPGARNQRPDANHAVDQRVLAVNPEMDETRLAHRSFRTSRTGPKLSR